MVSPLRSQKTDLHLVVDIAERSVAASLNDALVIARKIPNLARQNLIIVHS